SAPQLGFLLCPAADLPTDQRRRSRRKLVTLRPPGVGNLLFEWSQCLGPLAGLFFHKYGAFEIGREFARDHFRDIRLLVGKFTFTRGQKPNRSQGIRWSRNRHT